MKSIQSIFFGTPEFALASLQATRDGSDLKAVVCQPDRPRGRGQKLSPCPVKEKALEWSSRGVKIFSPASLKKPSVELDELKEFLARNPVDLFVVTAYGNLLTQEFLDFPKLGAVNVHASLLPRWRGAAPIQRCLEAGDSESGVALQKMVMELDAGDILIEKKIALKQDIDALELSPKLSILGGDCIKEMLEGLNRTRELRGTKQDTSQVTLAPKIKKEEGDWRASWTAIETHNRIRGFRAWPGVRARLVSGEELKILKTEVLNKPGLAIRPGEIIIHEDNVYLGSGAAGEAERLCLRTVQAANKGPVSAFDFFQNLQQKDKEAMRFL